MAFAKLFFNKNKNNDLVKQFADREAYRQEINTYLQFLGKNIFPLTSPFEINSIILHTNGSMSLRSFLQNRPTPNLNLLLNELFCFVKQLKEHNFVHNNLTIDNVFVKWSGNFQFTIVTTGTGTTNSTVTGRSDLVSLYTSLCMAHVPLLLMNKIIKMYLSTDILDEVDNFMNKKISNKHQRDLDPVTFWKGKLGDLKMHRKV